MPLDVRNAITTVEAALLEVIELAFKVRLPAQATVAALRTAFTVKLLGHRALVYVTGESRVYRWDRYSTAADDGVNVIAPTPLSAAGRWLRVSSPVNYGPNYNAPLQSKQTGYLKTVTLYRGDELAAEMQEKADGNTPFVLIEWMGDSPKPMSLLPGALYDDTHNFNLLIGSFCARNSNTNPWGSPLAAEATEDPGPNAIIGDLRYVLAGVALGIPHVVHVEIGDARKVDEDLEDRLLLYSLAVSVRIGFTIPDEDLEPLVVQVTPRLADHPPPKFDPLNYVAQGYFLEEGIGAGLSRTFGEGIAFISGAAISSTPDPVTFTADRDTYRDLKPDGTFAYTAVAVGAAAPPLTAGALRLAVTRTAAAEVLSDTWLCSSSHQYGLPFTVP